jgi:hypothetical protein
MNQSSHGGWDSVNGPVSPRRDSLRERTRTVVVGGGDNGCTTLKVLHPIH